MWYRPSNGFKQGHYERLCACVTSCLLTNQNLLLSSIQQSGAWVLHGTVMHQQLTCNWLVSLWYTTLKYVHLLPTVDSVEFWTVHSLFQWKITTRIVVMASCVEVGWLHTDLLWNSLLSGPETDWGELTCVCQTPTWGPTPATCSTSASVPHSFLKLSWGWLNSVNWFMNNVLLLTTGLKYRSEV